MERTFATMLVAAVCLAAPLASQDQPTPKPRAKAPVEQQARPGVKDRARPKTQDTHESADTVHDGKTEPGERRENHREHMKEAWERYLKQHPEAAAEMKKKADANGDGKVDAQEREQMVKLFREQRQEGREQWKDSEVFDQADGNDNGKLDPRERHALRHEVRDQVRDEMRERADTNGDGKVDTAEREAWRTQVKEHADRNSDGKVGTGERREMKREVRGAVRNEVRSKTKDAAQPPK